MPKTYLVQVEGTPSEAALQQLRDGVLLNDGLTAPAAVRLLDEPPALWARTPPVRVRLTVPTAWLELRITEGRNRQARRCCILHACIALALTPRHFQVRRMTAAVALPTLRLVRVAVGPWSLGELQPGEWRELPHAEWAALT
jgi:23S rRNA pseudouridine2457 synthase